MLYYSRRVVSNINRTCKPGFYISYILCDRKILRRNQQWLKIARHNGCRLYSSIIHQICRNTLAILISVELMLNATDINFAVFNRFLFPGGMEGYFFALFSIAISAAETAVAIAIMINIYRNLRSIQVRNLDDLKW